MKGLVRAVLCLASGLVVGLGSCLAASAADTGGATSKAAAATTDSLPLEPPLFPAKSPVDLFRELLALPPGERGALLNDRSPESRKRIFAKVREYESLKPDVRE